ncbi:metalloendoproteinase 2-MMP-like [Impatiens glandulifera]|uniref:metalloendoproteinase 2-MMP-like n=1 Tax=Impatiens glandulifera TaxID=253017 RepID=UPI001FB11950|nr:metalloendoproteinase 2-MMP-like [Impatiens glandulifera]
MNAIYNAFGSWQGVTRFNFMVSYGKPDILISFTSFPSEDYEPFLRHSGIMAYADLPPKGKLHFRADVPWSNAASGDKMDIETIAVHELGHILGLRHINVPSAVMWPYSELGVIKRKLYRDDILAIKALYNFR